MTYDEHKSLVLTAIKMGGLDETVEMVAGVLAQHDEDRAALIDVIRGLLVNWPHTEAVEHTTQLDSRRCVLTKAEALKRAAAILTTA